MSELATIVVGGAPITAAEMRMRVLDFEREQLKKPQVEIPVEHNFFPGGYARTIRVPAGVEMTGAIHKYQNFNLLVSGELLIIAEDGPKHLIAPAQFWSPPGTKRVGKMLTDVVWTTILATDLTDVAEITAKFTCNSEQDYLAFTESLKLKGSSQCHS